MKRKTYYNVVSTIFLLVAVLHFIRIINNWEAYIGDIMIPMWMSWVAVILLGYLIVRGFSYEK